jgi:hypothetical protein
MPIVIIAQGFSIPSHCPLQSRIMKLDALIHSLCRRLRSLASKASKSQKKTRVVLYSEPLEDVHLIPPNSFTTLPCRIHKKDNLAIAGAEDFQREWAAIADIDALPPAGNSSIGHCVSLALPECLPERLSMCAFLLEGGCLRDGMCRP